MSERSERELPEFAPLLDSEAVRDNLHRSARHELFPGHYIASCEVGSVRYKTYEDPLKRMKSSALARYDVETIPENGGAATRSQVFLRSFLDPSRRPMLGDALPGAATVPGLNANAWLVSGDQALADLRVLLDPTQIHTIVPQQVALTPENSFSTRVLRYKPEDRCTVEVQIHHPYQPDKTLVAKTFALAGRAQAIANTSRKLAEAVSVQQSRLVVPELICRRSSTLWLSHIDGSVPVRADLNDLTLRAIATALADFHALAKVTTKVRSRSDQLDQTQRKIKQLRSAAPEANHLLDRVWDSLNQDAQNYCDSLVTVHGAFRLRQLLISGQQIGLVDFDSVALGDPAEDLADFVLDLGLGLGIDGAPHAIEVFLTAYEHAVGSPVDARRIDWQLPIQIIKRAHWLRSEARRSPSVMAKLIDRLEMAVDSTVNATINHKALLADRSDVGLWV